jgi:hypothetical protein
MRIRDPGWRQFGSGIRDGKKSDLGSGINIPGSATLLFNINFLSFFRDSYGNFLARLETVFGVSQKGVRIIAGEMCELSNRVLPHCMKSVTEHLGEFKPQV